VNYIYIYIKKTEFKYRWFTGWTIGVLEFDSRRRVGIFFFITASKKALGPTQLSMQWVPGGLLPWG
jgi:hypothetical protein